MDNNNLIKNSGNFIPAGTDRQYFLIIVLNTVFGLQIISSFFSLLVNYLRERPTVSLVQVAIYALVTFLLVFLAGFLFLKLQKRALFLVLVIGVSVLRFIIQVSRTAAISLAISALGSILWIISIIFFISLAQQRRIKLFFTVFPAVIFGFSINTCISGLMGTWDMVWRPDMLIIIFLALIIVFNIILASKTSFGIERSRIYYDGTRSAFYSLPVVMPFVFLQLYQFQNIAALDAKAGFTPLISTSILIVSNIAALAFSYLISVKKLRIPVTIVSAVFIMLAFWPEITGGLYVLQLISGNIAAWWLILCALNRAVSYTKEKLPLKDISALGLSGILLFIFAFIYYGSYGFVLPFKIWVIPVLISAALGVSGILSASLRKNQRLSRVNEPGSSKGKDWSSGKYNSSANRSKSIDFAARIREFLSRGSEKYALIFLMFALFIVPLAMNINTGYNTATAIQRDNVRVLHYNIHQGFNIDGYLDLEGIARVIEANGADIVSLNEVSRGWVINGSADTFEWLASRLGMKYKFFTPSADSVWGNAILSRYPLKLLGSGFLPLMNTYQQRSYLITGVDLSSLGIKNVTMFTTHLHDIPQDSQKRQAQIKALLELIKVNERKVIFGDFNSETGSPENNMMENAGFIDTQLALGKQDELTWAHYKPYRRIDYIWTTPDIEISDFSVTYSRASDHLPIALNIK